MTKKCDSIFNVRALLAFLSLIIIFSSFESRCCDNTPIRVGVIDTGFGFMGLGKGAKLCKYGHRDFSVDQSFTSGYDTVTPVPLDTNGHGTNIVGIIDSYAKDSHVDYCIVIIKYHSDSQSGYKNTMAESEAMEYAANIKMDIVNISAGGPNANEYEYQQVERFLNNGGTLVAAAGNDDLNIDKPGNAFYPATYDKRIIVVGNKTRTGIKSVTSNYGKSVTHWELGEDVAAYGITASGTSQSCAIKTGKLINEIHKNNCKIN